jgi:hypothetical protein
MDSWASNVGMDPGRRVEAPRNFEGELPLVTAHFTGGEKHLLKSERDGNNGDVAGKN